MNIAYIRVSTTAQDFESQEKSLEHCEMVYREKVSGVREDRPELRKMLETLRPGDVVNVFATSRISRSLKNLLSILDAIESKGAFFVSVSEGLSTQTPVGRTIIEIMSSIAGIEREQIRSRCAEGLKVAKANGVRLGRPPKSPDNLATIKTLIDAGQSTSQICSALNMSRATFYRRLGVLEKV